MKKRYYILYLLFVLWLSGCSADGSWDTADRTDTAALELSEIATKELYENDESVPTDILDATGIEESMTDESSASETIMVEDEEGELQITEVNKCVHFLHKNGKVLVDANEDGIADTFRIDYVDREGGLYIEEFEFSLGEGGSFRILESELPYTFNGHIEYIDTFDFNEDEKEELLVMFDTHGGGGQGTHELYVLWLEEDGSIIFDGPISHVEMPDTVRLELSEEARVDTIYHVQKIEVEGKLCLQVRQYAWENFHTDSIGDLVSIVSLEKGSNTLVAEEAWLTLEQPEW